MVAAGLCHACGAAPIDKSSRSRCKACLVQSKTYMRHRHNCHELLKNTVPLLRTHPDTAARLLEAEVLKELNR